MCVPTDAKRPAPQLVCNTWIHNVENFPLICAPHVGSSGARSLLGRMVVLALLCSVDVWMCVCVCMCVCLCASGHNFLKLEYTNICQKRNGTKRLDWVQISLFRVLDATATSESEWDHGVAFILPRPSSGCIQLYICLAYMTRKGWVLMRLEGPVCIIWTIYEDLTCDSTCSSK